MPMDWLTQFQSNHDGVADRNRGYRNLPQYIYLINTTSPFPIFTRHCRVRTTGVLTLQPWESATPCNIMICVSQGGIGARRQCVFAARWVNSRMAVTGLSIHPQIGIGWRISGPRQPHGSRDGQDDGVNGILRVKALRCSCRSASACS